MKIRNSFISNSSTASFIVKRFEYTSKEFKRILSKAKEKKLLDYGFFLTPTSHPSRIDYMTDPDLDLEKAQEEHKKAFNNELEDEWLNLGYTVVCNEDEPIGFLIKNRISFISLQHYGHHAMLYDGETDELVFAPNLGNMILTSIPSEIKNREIPEGKVVYTTGKKYLKEGSYNLG